MKTDKEKWEMSVEMAAKLKGISPESILGRSRKYSTMIARHLARWIACECLGVTREVVGSFTGFHHATITNSIVAIRNIRDVCFEMKETSDKIKVDLNGHYVAPIKKSINSIKKTEIIQRIRNAMDAKQFAVVDIARKTGLAEANLRKILNRGSCQMESFAKICECLEVSTDYILFGKYINRRRTKWNSQ